MPTAGNAPQAGNLRPKDIFSVFAISTFYQATHLLPVSTMYLDCFNTYYLQMAVQASWRQKHENENFPVGSSSEAEDQRKFCQSPTVSFSLKVHRFIWYAMPPGRARCKVQTD